VFARHDVVEHEPNGPAQEPRVHTDETARRVRGSHNLAEVVHRQAYAGKDLETDGQSGQAMSTFQDESEELAAVHTRHTAGHLSAAQVHIHAVRERPLRIVQQRAFQRVHIERDTQVQTSHQTVQRRQGEDV